MSSLCTSSRYPFNVSKKRRVCKCFDDAQLQEETKKINVQISCDPAKREEPYTEMPSSLMMYPIP